ncbi:hypothetical protein ACFQ08_08190 [Streptosporangium algeriense]|uniref:Uncharacterized protein n=1 Tax=Streptosporangium algeriense TaxID=1682748 RepID=A0ABW3DL73_9ACTN
MPSDPDHVLDAIDGVVDEWLAMSEDSMRWAPPEKPTPRPRLALPAPPLPPLVEGLMQEAGARVQAVAEAFRPLGEGVVGVLTSIFDSDAVRRLIEPADWPEEHPDLDVDDPEEPQPPFGEPSPEEPPSGASSRANRR